jgi:hypothetical protein
MANFPSKSVVTEFLVPFSTTFTPGIETPEASITVPLTAMLF